MSVQRNAEWLQHHTEQYRSTMNDMYEVIKDFDEVEKLG
jgi:predicted SAM-dependent methyltransferase